MKIKALAIALAFLAFAKLANAVPVTVNSVQYDITTVTTTLAADSAELISQPWWGNETLAINLANALGGALGFPNVSIGSYGPLFAYNSEEGFLYAKVKDDYGVLSLAAPTVSTFTFAVVSSVPDSASTLGLTLLSATALVFAGRRFKRVQV